MRGVAAVPRRAGVRKLHMICITARRRDDKHVREIAVHIQSVAAPIDRRLFKLSNGLLLRVEEVDVEDIVGADAALVALVLGNVEGTPARAEARGMHDGVGGNAVSAVGADDGDATRPGEGLVADATEVTPGISAEVATIVVVLCLVGQGLHVDWRPIVDLETEIHVSLLHDCGTGG